MASQTTVALLVACFAICFMVVASSRQTEFMSDMSDIVMAPSPSTPSGSSTGFMSKMSDIWMTPSPAPAVSPIGMDLAPTPSGSPSSPGQTKFMSDMSDKALASAPTPSGSPTNLTYSSMVIGLLAFIITFLAV